MPTVGEIHRHLLENAPWVDPAKTVDTIKAGDPEKEVAKVAVGWMATIWDLRRAVELGCDVFITHEPTFWEHAAPEQENRDAPGGREKTALLEESGLAVVRCHDAWDFWPETGIRAAWAEGLCFTDLVAESGDKSTGMYAVPETTLMDLARHVAEKVRPIGQRGVQLLGDPEMKVSRPSVGVGCILRGMEMIEKGSDCIICCFDGASYWRGRERFVELGAGVLTVEHGCTEHWGLEKLAAYIGHTWPELEVEYLALYPRPLTVL